LINKEELELIVAIWHRNYEDLDSLPWIIHWRRYFSILTIHFNKNKNKIVRVIKSMEWIGLQEINVLQRIFSRIMNIEVFFLFSNIEKLCGVVN
jgi:hypothetical protein